MKATWRLGMRAPLVAHNNMIVLIALTYFHCFWSQKQSLVLLRHIQVRLLSHHLQIKVYENVFLYFAIQPAKKVVSDSLGLVDFAIGLVNSVLNLPDGKVKYLRNSGDRRAVKSICSSKNFER